MRRRGILEDKNKVPHSNVWLYLEMKPKSTSQDTYLMTSTAFDNQYFTSIKIDSAEIPVAQTYRFSSTSTHSVEYELNPELASEYKIGDSSFGNIEEITYVYFDNISEIGNSAFYGCSGLTSINLPDGVRIDEYAFSSCNGLTSLDLPGNSYIDDSAFYGCSGLTTVNIPNENINIKSYVFERCDNLSSITFDSTNWCTDTYIGYKAFEDCPISSITLPPWVAFNSDNPFVGNPLETISARSSSQCDYYTKIENNCFIRNNKAIILSKNSVIPSYVTEIYYYAAQSNPTITEFTIPGNVKLIRNSAFARCSLTRVVLEEGVQTLEYGVFSINPLEYISIASTVTRFGPHVFSPSTLSHLNTEVYVYPSTPPSYEGDDASQANIFGWTYCYDSLIIHVPRASLSQYKSSSNPMWATYKDYMVGDL